VEVGGADGGHEVRAQVAVHRDRARRPQLGAEQDHQLVERLGGLGARGDRGVVPGEPGAVVVGEVVARAHRRHDEPHAAAAQVRDLLVAS